MKRAAAVMLAACLASAPVFAQAPAASAADKPATAPMTAPQPAEEVKLAAGKGPSRATEDARECLKFSDNTEIIKCAEKYL